jgi:hypothetical protein
VLSIRAGEVCLEPRQPDIPTEGLGHPSDVAVHSGDIDQQSWRIQRPDWLAYAVRLPDARQ